MATLTVPDILKQIAAHERGDQLCRLVRDCLFDAADGRRSDLDAIVAARALERELTREQAQMAAGNVVEALEGLATDSTSGMLVSALLARALMLDPPQGVEAEDKVAERLAWIGATTNADVLGALDEVLGDKAAGIWGALADLVQRHDARGAGGRAQALVAAAALGSSDNGSAKTRAAELAGSMRNAGLVRMVSGGPRGEVPAKAPALTGELARAPRGALATLLLAACGWLLAANVGRVLGRLALKYSRPTEVLITPRGVMVRGRTELMGKVLREHEMLIPLDGLARATREVRFPKTGTYAGLIALALGSYLGVSWFIDGVRATSFSLMAVGMLVILLGISLDFALSSLWPGKRGKCRVVFVPKRGAAICVAQVDTKSADATMAALAQR
jgi:hypothetical protein